MLDAFSYDKRQFFPQNQMHEQNQYCTNTQHTCWIHNFINFFVNHSCL